MKDKSESLESNRDGLGNELNGLNNNKDKVNPSTEEILFVTKTEN